MNFSKGKLVHLQHILKLLHLQHLLKLLHLQQKELFHPLNLQGRSLQLQELYQVLLNHLHQCQPAKGQVISQ
jgi:hypothetical protein